LSWPATPLEAIGSTRRIAMFIGLRTHLITARKSAPALRANFTVEHGRWLTSDPRLYGGR
jgi:hypothetical protein